MKINSVIRRTIIINDSNLTESVREHHSLNDECLIDNEDVISFVGN